MVSPDPDPDDAAAAMAAQLEVARKAAHVLVDTVSAYEQAVDGDDVSLWLALLPAANLELNQAGALLVVADGQSVAATADLAVNASWMLLASSLMTNLLLTHIQQQEHLDRNALIHDLREWIDRYFTTSAK